MQRIIDNDLLKIAREINKKDLKIDALFCLNCGQGFITVVEYKNKMVECTTCKTKHKVRFYKNGTVNVKREEI